MEQAAVSFAIQLMAQTPLFLGGEEVPWTDDAEGSGHLNRGIRGIAPQGLD